MLSTNAVWLTALKTCLNEGNVVAPRGKRIKELLGHQTKIDMNLPCVTIPERKLGYKFMAAEAAWILSGDNRVETIAPYSKAISNFSDDGYFFHGAYGPMIRDQLHFVAAALNDDKDSRQAVLTIWRPNPRPSKDIPCTVSVQFLIRDDKLYVIDTMRSSDLWLGWPYDVFNFSMLARYLLCLLDYDIELGDLILQAGSMHLYEEQWTNADLLVRGQASLAPHKVIPWFDNPTYLVDWLWEKANGTGILEA